MYQRNILLKQEIEYLRSGFANSMAFDRRGTADAEGRSSNIASSASFHRVVLSAS